MGLSDIGFDILKYIVAILVTLISIYFMFKNKLSNLETAMADHEADDNRRFGEIKDTNIIEIKRIEKKFDDFVVERKDESAYLRTKLDKIQSDISDVRVKLAEK